MPICLMATKCQDELVVKRKRDLKTTCWPTIIKRSMFTGQKFEIWLLRWP